jgi:NTP pyrophosphatase (non-canonical NTP hydrolase)
MEVIIKTIKRSAISAQALGDERLYRCYLMLEELQEVIQAMADNDEVELADGLGDLRYVVSGTAITYSIPLPQLFDAIHESNMSKKQRCLQTNPRMRDKGPDFFKPDIKGVIAKYREHQEYDEDEALYNTLMLVDEEFPAVVYLVDVRAWSESEKNYVRDWAGALIATGLGRFGVEIHELPAVLCKETGQVR